MSQVYEEAVARYLDAQAKAMETVKAAQTAIAELRDRGIATMDQHAHDMITAMRWQIAEKERAHASALERIARLEKREQWAANLLDIAKRDAKLPATLLQGIAQFHDERRADLPKEPHHAD